MAYGKIKADAIIRDNGGTDQEITMATIVGLDSNKAALTGATFTGDVLLDNEQELRLGEADANGANYVALKAPATLAQTSTWTMPADVPVAGQVLKVTSVANTNDPTLEWGADASGAGTAANTFTAAQAVTPSVQTSAGALDMDASNFIEVAGVSYNTTPTGLVVGTSGLFYADTAAPTNWHSTFKFVDGGYVAPTTFPAVAPWYVAETDEILVGAWTQGISVAGS
tara:strand:- start:1163 stop:1840 length:678 start_codon:yes stop_codon:yes gene_type:complete